MRAQAISSTIVAVAWDIVPPAKHNGIIIIHEVFFKQITHINNSQSMNFSGSEMSVFLHELEEFVSYNISVRAYTSAGAGPCSDEVTVTTLEDSKL